MSPGHNTWPHLAHWLLGEARRNYMVVAACVGHLVEKALLNCSARTRPMAVPEDVVHDSTTVLFRPHRPVIAQASDLEFLRRPLIRM